MEIRILDLDGSIPPQTNLLSDYRPTLLSLREWGPDIRLACSFHRFARFEGALRKLLEAEHTTKPRLTLYGSGDFHHVSLSLVRRFAMSINLLIVDNHPDWMRGVPFLHCGTWLYHAARLPHVHRIFHVGGDVDFDNYYQWLAPWRLLRAGKIVVYPATRRFQRGAWSGIKNEPLQPFSTNPLTSAALEELLEPFRTELASRPLYISLDKDVMGPRDAVVNWDSGHLTLTEVLEVLRGFLRAADGNLAGMDIVGDWSPVQLRGWLRYLMHFTEHPVLAIDPIQARRRNEHTNLTLVEAIRNAVTSAQRPVAGAGTSMP